MQYKIDPRVKEYFKNLKQVFIYIIDECNLSCTQCLYKPNLTFSIKDKEIPLETANALVSDFHEMGARKLTIMGGEPTLYGANKEWVPLLSVISKAKKIGYEYVRIDTNGQFDARLLEKEGFAKLDELTFSLDGHEVEINDPVRGKGSFDKCVSNIKRAVALGYNVNITSCLHRNMLLRHPSDGTLALNKMILFAEELGVPVINFHDLFKSGIPRDTWSGNIEISLHEWLAAYSEIQFNIEAGKYKIQVRMPQSFTTPSEFETKPSYYGYCPVKLGERVLVHPDGLMRVCSLLIGTPYGVAKFYDNKIVWDESMTNEIRDHKVDSHTPCTNQSKGSGFNPFVPLCVSFKPKQTEYVWVKQLEWEKNRD
jgi:MoaA/NifB/PqqE/SkfB family radical SAM enzyme